MNLTTAVQRLRLLIQNQEVNFDQATDTLEQVVAQSVDRYANDIGGEQITDLTGNATQALSMPSTFTYKVDTLKTVEYPVTTEGKPTLLAPDSYEVYRTPAGLNELRLYDVEPDTGTPVRITFKSYIDAVSDVPAWHEWAIVQLSGYFACITESQKSANTTSDGRALDFIDKNETSNRFETIGKLWYKNYSDRIWGSQEENDRKKDMADPASAQDTWQTTPRWNGVRIFHPQEDD